jgi:hypothetical protein
VFWHEIDLMAVDSKIRPAALLGHVAAHEIGHLLLGSRSHAVSGIMKANWRLKELVLVAQGRMLFDSSDAIRLSRSIIERNGARARTPHLATE